MSRASKLNINKYNMIWVAVIILIPLMELFLGVDLADVGFSMNQYRFCMKDMNSIYLPLLLTDVIGWALLQFFGVFGIPEYLGMELAWVFAGYYLCFLGYRLYKRYRDDSMILPALALAMLLIKTNFGFFIYNTSVAVMALTALYFLIRGMNDKKPLFLALASFFFVLASLCKISALMQFAVFAVLFYELYKTRDWRYFWKQLLYVILGFVAGLALAAVLLAATCGIDNYINMVIEMFFYAGTSTDGHTIGNMVMINIKGAVRGAMFVAVLAALCFLLKKCARFYRAATITVVSILALLILGKAAGLESVPGLGALYGLVFNFYNVIAVLVALIYLCLFIIIRGKEYSDEYKMLVLASGILTVIMPIGSNVGITHICNEFFLALPYILICIKDEVKKERQTVGGEKRPGPIALVVALAAVWIVALTGYQSMNKTRAYSEKLDDMAVYQIDELRCMKADRYSVEELEELVVFLEAYKDEDVSLTEVGGIPLINYLSDIKPTVSDCGGWIETDYVTAAEIAEQLDGAKETPVIVARKAALEEGAEKTAVVMNYVEKNSYVEVFANEEYVVYFPSESVKEN